MRPEKRGTTAGYDFGPANFTVSGLSYGLGPRGVSIRMESTITDSALRQRPRVKPDRAGADQAAADRRLARARPTRGRAQQHREHRGSAETGRPHARAHSPGRRARAPTGTYLTNNHPANSSSFGPDSHRVAKPSPKKAVCLVPIPCARATNQDQNRLTFFGHGVKENSSNAGPHTTAPAAHS